MINWKSILSSFNDKPTLLEWLKQVEKALKESVLTNVLTDTKDGKTAFIFKFADGTEIRTGYIQTNGFLYIHDIRVEIKREEQQIAWLSSILVSGSNIPIDNLSDFFTAFNLGYSYPFMGYGVGSDGVNQAVILVEPRPNGGIGFANNTVSTLNWSDPTLTINIIDSVTEI